MSDPLIQELGSIHDCEHGYRAAGGTLTCPICDGEDACVLHGKTIKGTMQMGEVYALDFTDGTHLWVEIKHHGPQDGGRVSIITQLREGPL